MMIIVWRKFWAWYHRQVARVENWIAKEMGLGAFTTFDEWGDE